MPKYYNVTMCGPYINSERTYSFEVEDDFDPIGKDRKEAMEFYREAMLDYTADSWESVTDEPKGELS